MSRTFLADAIDEAEAHQERIKAVGSQVIGDSPGTSLIASSNSGLSNALAFGNETAEAEEQQQHFVGWVYAAINLISTRMASLKFMAGLPTGSDADTGDAAVGSIRRKMTIAERRRIPQALQKLVGTDIDVVEDHWLMELLKDPNPAMPTWSIMYMSTAALKLSGRSYWWMPTTVEGERQLWPLPASWVTPDHSQGLFSQYVIRPPNLGTTEITVGAEEIANFPLPDPSNPLSVTSPVFSQAPAIAADEAIQTTQYRMFKNGLWPSVAIRVGRLPGMQPGSQGERPALEGHQRKEVIDAARAIWEGVANYGEPLILDGLIEGVDHLTKSIREMDFLKSGMVTKARITQAFGVNPILLGEITDANRAQAAVAEESFLSNVINPLGVLIAQVLTQWAKRNGDPTVFWFEEERASDSEQKFKEWSFAAAPEQQFVTKDEYRCEILGLPPMEEEDEPEPAEPEDEAKHRRP